MILFSSGECVFGVIAVVVIVVCCVLCLVSVSEVFIDIELCGLKTCEKITNMPL